ncbi:MAG TPA: hypothetical protein VEA36_03460 [Candidatus Paceibacterota bacterium]|nr:hypothetical protein [Candidatus Paceibacterota bacterium]
MRTPRTNTHVYGEHAFWLKDSEVKMARDGTLSVIVRGGDRSTPEKAPKQFLRTNEPVPCYMIAVPGDQDKGISAQFEADGGTTVEVVERIVKPLGEFTDDELVFEGGRAVPENAAGLKRYLEEELAPGKTFGPDAVITVYHVRRLPNEEPATD